MESASLTNSRAVKLFSEPLNRVRPLISLARKDGNIVLRFHTLCGSQGALLHAILVDGIIKRIEGRPELADAAVKKQRKAGHVCEYLFAARSEKEFERKRNAIPLLQRQCGTAH